MPTALLYDRLQFALTATFHYLFPQLTMGLALLVLYLKTRALRSSDPRDHDAARFWIRVFALSFVFGVVTGIPMEFQFGTNWAKFSEFAGGVIGQTLAQEGLFAFFLESSFLGILLWGEQRFGPRVHWVAALMLFLGSWLSAYFILATNAWMQHPARRAARAASHLGWAAVVLTAAALVALPFVQPTLRHNFADHPVGYLLPTTGALALGALLFLRQRGRDLAAFAASSLFIIAMLGSAALCPPRLPRKGPA